MGTIIGFVFGIIPGISGTQAMAILLPFTFVMDQAGAMVFLVSIMAVGGFAGSITSILLNVPGEPTNAATTLDGYPLARQGKAGVAIAASATASALGSLFGLLLLVLSIPILRELVLYFGPPELFALAIAGIALIGGATGGEQVKGLIAGACGMIIGAIGYNLITGEVRYTGGALQLFDGVPLIASVVGLFALPELYRLIRVDQRVSSSGVVVSGGVGTGIRSVFRRPLLVIRSGLIGTGIGIIPGVGGAIASWIAYYAAKRTSRSPETFGKGNIEGVIAPDTTLNAKEGGAMIPVLALGLPGSLSTAILLSAFLLHGVSPGQRMFDQHMDLVWAMIFTLALVNLLISGIGLLITNQLVKVTLVPARALFPIVLVLVLIGSYVERQSFTSIMIAILFGFAGIAMTHLGYPRAPLLVGMILFPIAEKNFHVSLQISWGSYDFLLRPITFTALLIVAVALVVPYVWRHWVRPWTRSRERVPVGTAGEAIAKPGEPETPAEPPEPEKPADRAEPDPRYDALAALAVLAAAVALVVTSFGYSEDARFFPLIVLTVLIALSLWQTGKSLHRMRSRPRGPLMTSPASLFTETSVLTCLGWVLLLPALIWSLGATTAIFVYAMAFVLGYRPRRPRPANVALSVIIAVILTVVAQYGFEYLLGIQLPESRLFPISY